MAINYDDYMQYRPERPNEPHPPRPPHPPRYTMTEEIEHALHTIRETVDRIHNFADRTKAEIAELSRNLSSDNVIFKDTVCERWNTFLIELQHDLADHKSEINAEWELYKSEVGTEYKNLADDMQNLYNAFIENVNARLESHNTAHETAYDDFQRSINTQLNEFEMNMNTDYETFTNGVNTTIQNFMDNWETTITTRLAQQDGKIDDAELYMKTNLRGVVTDLVGDMHANGEFVDIIEGEVFNDLDRKVDGMNRTSINYYGCIGDGVTDDTDALKAALAHDGCLFIPDGVYITNEPLYVNVNRVTLIGGGSRSVIKAGENFPVDEAIITFYSPDGDYYDRNKRVTEHGCFSVFGNSNQNCNGVRFGGKVSTEYEGHVESSVFKLIHAENCLKAFVWGAHCYRNTLLNCESHACAYSLYTAEDITDTGEVFTCINCGFWSGAMHIVGAGELMVLSSTVHTKAQTNYQTDSGYKRVGHLFKDVTVNFQNCHFESIMHSADECMAEMPSQFYAENALVNIRDCVAVITGDYMTLADPLFVDISTNGYPHGINIDGGQWKYYLGRLHVTTLSTGNVRFTNIGMKYTFDGVSIPYKVYKDSRVMTLNAEKKFDRYFNLTKEQADALTISERLNGDGSTTYTITPDTYIDKTAIGFYRRIPVDGYKTVVLNGELVNDAEISSTLSYQHSAPGVIMFADMYDNFIPWGEPNNADLYTQANILTINGRFVNIPPNAKYMYVGFDVRRNGGFTGAFTVITSLIAELL